MRGEHEALSSMTNRLDHSFRRHVASSYGPWMIFLFTLCLRRVSGSAERIPWDSSVFIFVDADRFVGNHSDLDIWSPTLAEELRGSSCHIPSHHAHNRETIMDAQIKIAESRKPIKPRTNSVSNVVKSKDCLTVASLSVRKRA